MQFIGYDMLSLPENYEAFTTATPVLSGVMTVPYTLILDGNIGTGIILSLSRLPAHNLRSYFFNWVLTVTWLFSCLLPSSQERSRGECHKGLC